MIVCTVTQVNKLVFELPFPVDAMTNVIGTGKISGVESVVEVEL